MALCVDMATSELGWLTLDRDGSFMAHTQNILLKRLKLNHWRTDWWRIAHSLQWIVWLFIVHYEISRLYLISMALHGFLHLLEWILMYPQKVLWLIVNFNTIRSSNSFYDGPCLSFWMAQNMASCKAHKMAQ